MKSFKDFLTESSKEVVFTFGRFNPPTTGHEKLLDALAKVAGKNKYMAFASQSNDAKKNPLDFETKIKWMRKMFPKHSRNIILDKKVKNAFDICVKLYNEGFTKITMVVGSDRVPEFEKLLSKYNGVEARHGLYNFKEINIVSAGERDPDAEGVTGMSASKMRAAAAENNLELFQKGLPNGFKDGKGLFNDVRNGMGLKESAIRDHIQLKPVSEAREEYVNGNMFTIKDTVKIKSSDEIGEIKYLGANYVVVETAERITKQWIDAVEKL